MGVFFSGRELVDVAVGIERNGEAFYSSLVASAGDSNVRGIYQHLADREREHIEIFQNMLGSLSDYQPPETFTDEYEAYLRALINSSVFTDTGAASEMARKVNSDLEAIQIGLGAEKDSILFYLEMRDIIRKSDRDVVSKIIEEEKSHVRQLMDLRRSFS